MRARARSVISELGFDILPDQKVGARIIQEMSKRGVITRARMEHIFYSPAIVITEAELDRMVSVTQEAVKAVTGK
jgi:adenosylmethionine-8-amino-7-oxononanoate aminotransferase